MELAIYEKAPNEVKTTVSEIEKSLFSPNATAKALICEEDGIVVFKCQDTVSGGKNHFTHTMIMNMAIEIGFYPKDLFILLAKMRINSFGGRWNKQEHARKYHSYFIVLQKTKPKVNYDFKKYM
jgi:hypothetical protein